MSYLLDTNVISELVKPKPNIQVLAWFETIPNDEFYLSVLTLGKIRKGVESIKDKSRQDHLRRWLEKDLPAWFGDRILSLNGQIADRWGRLQAQIKKTLPAIDSLLAATALYHDLRLVTRNENDFQYPSLIVVNPWKK
jgi:predicted nucleic acid-binding protein